MSKIVFRNFLKESDLKSIEEITKSSGFFESVPTEIATAVSDAKSVLDSGAEAAGSEYVFLELDGEVVGFTSFGAIPLCDNSYYLYWIAMHEKCRNKGLGKHLIYEALRKMFSNGGRKVFLQTSSRPDYLPTREFYLKMGFVLEAELKDYYKEGEGTSFFSIKKIGFEALTKKLGKSL